MRWLITGANGHLGRRLISRLRGENITAVVRTPSAASSVRPLLSSGGSSVHVIDYANTPALVDVMRGTDVCVHLVGIIRESPTTSFEAAHIETTDYLVNAMARAGLTRLVYISLLGTDRESPNRCFATRGEAEAIMASKVPVATILRTGMVLGEGDHATIALARRATRGTNFVFRADSLEQPIFAGDLVEGILRAADAGTKGVIELAGPQSIPRGELIALAARILGHSTRVVSLPLAWGHALASTLGALMNAPPISSEMLDVLDHDDAIAADVGAERLGISLTSLDEMLERLLVPGRHQDSPAARRANA